MLRLGPCHAHSSCARHVYCCAISPRRVHIVAVAPAPDQAPAEPELPDPVAAWFRAHFALLDAAGTLVTRAARRGARRPGCPPGSYPPRSSCTPGPTRPAPQLPPLPLRL